MLRGATFPRNISRTGSKAMVAPRPQAKMVGEDKRPAQLPSVSLSAATAQSPQTAQPTNQQPKPKPKPKAHKTGWLYKDVDRQRCLRTVTPTRLAPCGQPVTSDGEVVVLGTFCWTSKKTVRVPSREPFFQHVALPAVLPPAPDLRAAARITPKASKSRGKNGAGGYKANKNNNNNTMPPHSLAPLAQAITTMSPSHRLRGTDLVVQRNSLRKLFALCSGRNPESFRVGLHLVNDTLVITKQDRFTWHPGVTRASGVGLSFEQRFTTALPGRKGDQAHHRVITYGLGDLRCVVQFEVDACYSGEQETAADEPTAGELAVEEQLRLLSLEPAAAAAAAPPKADATPAPKTTPSAATVVDCADAAPQSTVAEMKTSNKEGRLGETLPQLWFGRTPWLIRGLREGNAVTAVQVTRADEHFAAWEERHQETLRRVVTLVRELRDSVRAAGPGARHCVLVYDRTAQEDGGAQQRVVRVYRSNSAKEPLPRDMVQRLWGPD
ncbi:hypothetical protein RB595_003906 [Gaeumannomyces hyphopodioides]